jgi:hypothetical protein
MKFLIQTMGFLLALSTSLTQADVIDLQLDQSQSNTLVTFTATAIPTGQTLQSTDTSSLAGPMNISLGTNGPPFGTAQIQMFESNLADGLNFNFNFAGVGLVTIASAPGNTEIDLTSFGGAGSVAGGQFSQLGNVLRNHGRFVVNGGGFTDEPFDFDFDNNQDFVNYTVSRAGDVVTVTGSFDFNWDFSEGVFAGNVRYQGDFVAFGAVPEPHSALVLGVTALLGICVRRRR